MTRAAPPPAAGAGCVDDASPRSVRCDDDRARGRGAMIFTPPGTRRDYAAP